MGRRRRSIAKLKLDIIAANLGLNPPGGELSIAPPDGFGVHEVDPAASTGEVWPELTTKIRLLVIANQEATIFKCASPRVVGGRLDSS
jgi:hypothetical protein